MKESDRRLVGEVKKWSCISGNRPVNLSKLLCVSDRTFYRYMADPGCISLAELRQIIKVAKIAPSDILKILEVKE